jgi:hypothetical protein
VQVRPRHAYCRLSNAVPPLPPSASSSSPSAIRPLSVALAPGGLKNATHRVGLAYFSAALLEDKEDTVTTQVFAETPFGYSLRYSGPPRHSECIAMRATPNAWRPSELLNLELDGGSFSSKVR